MKITEITASVSTKLNNGNYESTDYFLSLKAIDEDGIKPGTAALLQQTAEGAILETLVKQYKLKGVKTTRRMIAKQHALANAPRADENVEI
tara:strand:+ start:341 stop:613 length:273 start_codon:yes stop_codon:yes gene_type:complete